MYSTVPDDRSQHGRFGIAAGRGRARGDGSACALRPTRRPAPPVDRAMPKSMISASPSLPIMMFAGFRSRWTTPAACAATRPDTTDRMIRSVIAIGSRPVLP